MSYSVKEIFYSLQGEGAQVGRPTIFCRFSGCNLWSGREQDRSNAICKFCDTDFIGVDGIGGGKFKDALSLAKNVKSYWPKKYFGPGLPIFGVYWRRTFTSVRWGLNRGFP
jgi:7-carboxy-7-deazaguanine synthase